MGGSIFTNVWCSIPVVFDLDDSVAKGKNVMKNTFLIYAVHQIMALFLNKMGNLFLGNSMYIGGIIFLMIPVIVTVFCYCMEKSC